jgi:cytoskeleton protein RodZ
VTRIDAEVAELPTDPGARLRRQRELGGLNEQQAAEQLNLDVNVVTALERNDFASLGAPVFARGHLKRYAALLGLGEEEILGAYDRLRGQFAQPSLIPKSREEMMPVRGRPRWAWLVGGVVLFLLAAGIAAYVREYGLRLPNWAGPDRSRGAAASPVPTPAAATLVPAAGEAMSNAGSPVQAPAAVPAGQVALLLGFAADCWVEIYDGSGKSVLYDLGKSGTQRSVSGAPPLSVTLGNAPAVTLQVNGRAVTPPVPPAGQTVARFSVGPDGSLR